MKKKDGPSILSPELRHLVKWSGALLGNVIQRELGTEKYRLIESLRDQMARLRSRDPKSTLKILDDQLETLRNLDRSARLEVGRSFTLLLELMNACENAYRSHRQGRKWISAPPTGPANPRPRPDAIIYVLTSHPTEARSPENIAIFREIETTLIHVLNQTAPPRLLERRLFHQLELAWRIDIVRARAPKVKDEAEHIYSILFEEGVFTSLLDASFELAPVYIRSWAGGDKDGHPGVDEKAMRESLALSRRLLVEFISKELTVVRADLELLPHPPLSKELASLKRYLSSLKNLSVGDGKRIKSFRGELKRVASLYQNKVGSPHPSLTRLGQVMRIFPGLVVPLELRESSDVLMSRSIPKNRLAIARMLEMLAAIARGGEPRWYARGLIVSMTGSIEHIRAGASRVREAFGACRLPVIPLFEEVPSLGAATSIVRQMARDPALRRDLREHWEGRLEIMVGYSDSAKESGVFPSRLAIARAMNEIDRVCRREKIEAVFFQGSGGSIDRGGGAVQDQTAWWPRSALKVYKVTVQGEMVERSFATPEITRRQIERIFESTSAAMARPAIEPRDPTVQKFAEKIRHTYQETIQNPEFLRIVQSATPYPHLSELKFGSRPAKRAQKGAGLSVKSLRAIPWVLCWTQTRVLFPTWWGIGTAWKQMSESERRSLRSAFATEPVYATFVRALGFTLAKVELPIFKIYLRESGLERELVSRFERLFDDEYRAAQEFLRFVSGSRDPLWFRPWLGESIRLRSPMIHPLNLLQLLALQERDVHLLRSTVTGISSGMLTTG